MTWVRVVVALVVLAWSATATAQQEISVGRIHLGSTTAQCTLRTGTGVPTGGGSCEFFLSTTTGDLWQNVGGTWRIVTTTPTVQTLTATTHVSSPLLIAAADMLLKPGGDLVVDPTGRDVMPAQNYYTTIGSPLKKFLALHAAELTVDSLVARDVMSTIGGRLVVAPTTVLSRDASPSDTVIYVKHNSFQLHTAGVEFGSKLFLERNGKFEVMFVTDQTPPTAQPDGSFAYSVLRNQDSSGANQWYAGDAVLDTGKAQTFSGFMDLYSGNGIVRGLGPTIVGLVRTSAAFNGVMPRWALGNLNNVGYGHQADFYGFAAGNPAGSFLYLDDSNGLVMRSQSQIHIQITPAGVATFAGVGTGITSINGGNILTDTITATQIAASAITTSELAAGAVTAGHIVAGNILSGHIAAGQITAEHLVAGTITAGYIAADAINAAHLAAGSVGASEIQANVISGNMIIAGTVGGGHIADASLGYYDIAADQIYNTHIADGQVTGADVQDGGVSGTDIGDYTIGWWDIANQTIQGWNIAPSTITGGLIASGTIVGGHIAARTIAAGNIAAGNITAYELGAGSVTAGHITAGAVTADKMSVGSLSAISANMGTITAGNIYGVYIEGATIVAAGGHARMDGNGIATSGADGIGGVKIGNIQLWGGNTLNITRETSIDGTLHVLGGTHIRGGTARLDGNPYIDLNGQVHIVGNTNLEGNLDVRDVDATGQLQLHAGLPTSDEDNAQFSDGCKCFSIHNSSSRYKENIRPWTPLDALAILKVPLVRYDIKAQPQFNFPVQPNRHGMLAEDLVTLMPEAVTLDAQNRPNGIRQGVISLYIITALRETAARVPKLEQQIADLEARLKIVEGKEK